MNYDLFARPQSLAADLRGFVADRTFVHVFTQVACDGWQQARSRVYAGQLGSCHVGKNDRTRAIDAAVVEVLHAS